LPEIHFKFLAFLSMKYLMLGYIKKGKMMSGSRKTAKA